MISSARFINKKYFSKWVISIAVGLVVYVSPSAKASYTTETIAGYSGTDPTGPGLAVTSSSTNATGTAARFKAPFGLNLDSDGNIYVTDFSNNLVRKIAANTYAVSSVGSVVGGNGVAVDSSGNVYAASRTNHTITKFTLSGGTYTPSTFAGTGSAGHADGTGTAATFNQPGCITFDYASPQIFM